MIRASRITLNPCKYWEHPLFYGRLRRNEVEGEFGEAKRKYGLDVVRRKLVATSESLVALRFMIMNLWRMLRLFLSKFILAREGFRNVIVGRFPGLVWSGLSVLENCA